MDLENWLSEFGHVALLIVHNMAPIYLVQWRGPLKWENWLMFYHFLPIADLQHQLRDLRENHEFHGMRDFSITSIGNKQISFFFVNTLGQLDKSRQGDGMSDLTQKLQCSKISQCPNRSRWWRPAMVVSSQVGWVDKLPSVYVKIVFEHDHRNSGNTHTHRIHGAAIYGNIYHQYTPVMLAYIPAPWILWDRTWWFSIVFCKRWPGRVASTEIDLGNLSWRLISF